MEKLSHAYIVSSSDSGERERLALSLASEMLCCSATNRPCGVCRNCRKVKNGTHPDLTFVRRLTDDKGKLKKEIAVDQIRDMSADAFVLPNEADAKVYIIEEAELMNEHAQNAALKTLEEPPKGAHFILCTDNPEKLLITVRSRCTVLRKNCDAELFGDDAGKSAEEFISRIESGKRHELLSWCMANEATDNAKTKEFLEAVKARLIMSLKQHDTAFSSAEALRLIELCEHCLAMLGVNTGTKHIYGLLAVKGIEEKS